MFDTVRFLGCEKPTAQRLTSLNWSFAMLFSCQLQHYKQAAHSFISERNNIHDGPPNLRFICLLVNDRIRHRAQILFCWTWFSFLLGRRRNGTTPFMMEKAPANITRGVLRAESCVQGHSWRACHKDQIKKSVLEQRIIKTEWQLTRRFPQFFSSTFSCVCLLLLCFLQNGPFHY